MPSLSTIVSIEMKIPEKNHSTSHQISLIETLWKYDWISSEEKEEAGLT